MTYSQLSHIASRRRIGTATATRTSTCRLNCVRAVGRVFRPDRWRATLFPNPPVPSRQPGWWSYFSEVIVSTSGRMNFWEERRSNFNIPAAKGTGKSLHYFALNITMDHNYNSGGGGSTHSDTKRTNWINDDADTVSIFRKIHYSQICMEASWWV